MAARHGAFGDGAGGAAVGEEIAGPQGDVLRLVVHVLAAGGQQEEREQENRGAGNLACSRLFRRLFAPVREASITPAPAESRLQPGLAAPQFPKYIPSAQLQIPPWAPASPDRKSGV